MNDPSQVDSQLSENGKSAGVSALSAGRVSRMQVFAAAAMVFAVAMLLRVPSCFESLWLDELHSSWTVWGGFEDVEPRARLGNQTPYYFWLLWGWRNAFGDSELALRLSSVILSSAACALLTMGIAHLRRQLPLAITAGLILAVEKNSIFFGTEFRGYAAILFLSAVFVLLSGRIYRRARPREQVMLAITGALMFMVNYTAALVSVAVVVVFWIASAVRASGGRRVMRMRLRDVGYVLLALGVVAAWEWSAISELWQRRGQWTFAVPKFLPIQQVWPWIPLVILPTVIGIVGCAVSRRLRPRSFYWMPLLGIVVGTTSAIHLLAGLEVVSLWHRRYMVGLVPVLAWGSAELWFAATRFFVRRIRFARMASGILVASIILVLMYSQWTIFLFISPEKIHIARRGEGWREMVAYVDENRMGREPVFVASGLIEARRLSQMEEVELEPMFLEYLCCAANNVYSVQGIQPITQRAVSREGYPDLRSAFERMNAGEGRGRRLWLIARISKRSAEKMVAQMMEHAAEDRSAAGTLRISLASNYGNVVVFKVESP